MSEVDNAQQAAAIEFNIQRIYTKDISFETPNSPAVFQREWKPEVKMDMDSKTQKLTDHVYEVVLTLTVTANIDNDVAFLCEVHQAGIFTVGEMPDPQLAHCLGSFCPNILYPYAREAVASLVSRGTFPQLNLAPVNFDALFASAMQQRAAQAAEGQKLDA